MELKQELTDIFQSFTDTQTDDSYKENYLLLQKSLSNVYECGRVCQAIPEQVLSLAERIGATLLNENIMTILMTAWSTISACPTAWI